MTSKLYEHIKHPHVPRNMNVTQFQEQHTEGFNTLLAVWLTQHVGSMYTAYSFVVLAIVGLLAILGILSPIVALLISWLSQTLIQLVLLPIIMVGQNVLNRKNELMAEEDFHTNQKASHDIEQVAQHLAAQDTALLDIQQLLQQQRIGGKK